MNKSYDFGYSRIKPVKPLEKIQAIIDECDKMSLLGWDYKGYYEMMSPPLLVLFFQREKTANSDDKPVDLDAKPS